MKKSYVKPVLNASMEGTLEGVYAYGNVMALCPTNNQPSSKSSKNEGCDNSCNGGLKYYIIVCIGCWGSFTVEVDVWTYNFWPGQKWVA